MIGKLITMLLFVFSFGFVMPEQRLIPVENATVSDWNPKSFWYYPWGKSGTHKGIDIFAKKGTNVIAPSGGFILYSGHISKGGNVVLMIGPKWRFHYFAHLQHSNKHRIGFVDAGHKIGTVGGSGNAAGKPAHLHYSIKSLFPRVWKFDQKQHAAWDRMFYINPQDYFRKT